MVTWTNPNTAEWWTLPETTRRMIESQENTAASRLANLVQTRTKEQSLWQRLAAAATPQLQRVSAMSPLQEQLFRQYSQGLLKTAGGLGASLQGVGQYSPTEAGTQFENILAIPARKQFMERTYPAIGESFVGPGTYWGSERALAEQRAASDFEAALGVERAKWMMQKQETAQTQALQAMGLGAQMTQAAVSLPAEAAYFQYPQLDAETMQYFYNLGLG